MCHLFDPSPLKDGERIPPKVGWVGISIGWSVTPRGFEGRYLIRLVSQPKVGGTFG